MTFHEDYNCKNIWNTFDVTDTNGYIHQYVVKLLAYYDPAESINGIAHYKILCNVDNTIYDFETLTLTISSINFDIEPHNISLVYMQKINSSKIKLFKPSNIDIPLFGNDEEIVNAYCSYYGLRKFAWYSNSCCKV